MDSSGFLGYLGFMAITDAHPTSEWAAEWIPEDTFATRLIAARKGRGLTQGEAAARCDLDDGSWSNWENGTKPRGMNEVVRKIADGLLIDRDWLMWGDNAGCPECGSPRSRCFCASTQLAGQMVLDLPAVA